MTIHRIQVLRLSPTVFRETQGWETQVLFFGQGKHRSGQDTSPGKTQDRVTQVRVTFVRVPTPGLGAADKGMMVTILGLWPQGHNPRMITIIPLSPGSTQPAVYTIRTRLGGPSSWSFPLEFTIG